MTDDHIKLDTPVPLQLDEHVRLAATIARAIFDGAKVLDPMVHAIAGDGKHLVLSVPQLGGTDAEKDAVAVGLRDVFKQHGVTQYVMLTEAWGLYLPTGTDINNLPRPRDRKDRFEMITLQGETKDHCTCGQMIITRDADGNPTLGELETWDGGTSYGRLTGLLKTAN